MENPATLQDVTGSFERPLTGGEAAVVPDWLGKAWRKLKNAMPALEARMQITDHTSPSWLDEQDVIDVLVAMVERKLRNPDGKRQWGDDSYNETVDTYLSSGRIYVTAEELAGLAPKVEVPENGMYSIPLVW